MADGTRIGAAGSTVGEAVRAAADRLRTAGVDTPDLKADFWISHVLGCTRLELPLQSPDELDADSRDRISLGLERLCRHEPLQYVEARADFMGRPFYVDPRVLIPRPETEQLVEMVLDTPGAWPENGAVIADVGTGSGCIVVSLALARPCASLVATDLHEDALAVARGNAERHGVADRIEFRQTSLLEGVAAESLDVVVSNPPYVATCELDGLPREVREYEPCSALDGGPDGLDLVRMLAKQAHNRLKPAGHLFVEIGETQGSPVRALLEDAGFDQVAIGRDLAGRVRMAGGRKA